MDESVIWLRLGHPACSMRLPLIVVPGVTEYAVTVTDGPVTAALEGASSGTSMRLLRARPWHQLPRRDRVLAAMQLPAGGTVLIPRSVTPTPRDHRTRRRWRRSLRVAHGLGLLDAAPVVVPGAGEPAVGATPSLRIGAHLHLFYPDLWDEFAVVLTRLPRDSVLHVTGPALPAAQLEAMRIRWPGLQFHAVENVGQDVWPFVKLLNDGAFNGLDAVLKLHGKKSAHPKILPCVGTLWRQAAVADLAGSETIVETAMAMFAVDPALGMLGPARLRVPNNRYDETTAWGGNKATTLALAGQVGMTPADFRLDYFAGTMFWVRPAALDGLRRLGLGPADFAPSEDARDGSLAHALERLLPALVHEAGFSFRNTPSS